MYYKIKSNINYSFNLYTSVTHSGVSGIRYGGIQDLNKFGFRGKIIRTNTMKTLINITVLQKNWPPLNFKQFIFFKNKNYGKLIIYVSQFLLFSSEKIIPPKKYNEGDYEV